MFQTRHKGWASTTGGRDEVMAETRYVVVDAGEEHGYGSEVVDGGK